jgi:Cu/Ag efflux protein CusF
LLLIVTPAFGQLLSDATGLVNRLDIETSGYTFEIETVANFDIQDYTFDKDEKRLTLYIDSGLENNLGEIIMPQNLLGGNFTFYLNDQEFFPKIKSNDKISFVTLNFTGSGNNKIEIFGTTYLNGLTEKTQTEYIADAVQKGETLDDSLGWWALAGFLVIIVAYITMKIKKRKQHSNN